MNLLSHSPFNAMFSSPVCLSPSVSPLLCCPPPYPAEIRLYWQSFPAPNTWRLNLSFNSCDITEHPPSHLISFFPCVYTHAGAASFLHSLPHYYQLRVAWMLSMNSSSSLSLPLRRVLLVLARVCVCASKRGNPKCLNVPFHVFFKLWNSINSSDQSVDLIQCVLGLFCNAL